MKHKINRILCAFLAVLLCVGVLATAIPSAQAESGTFGDDLTWVLENGTLTISGKGAMPNYSEHNPAPWMEYSSEIQRIVIEDGVTNVGKMAFYCLPNLVMVTLPGSVKKLGEQAFAGSKKLAQINLVSVELIDMGCFYECMSLVNVALGDRLHTIGSKAFYHCTSLAGITIPASVATLGNQVFTYCKSLVYVNILANITVLPYWTFYGCDALRQLYLPEQIETVEDNALAECPSLGHVDYGGSDEVREEIDKQLGEDTTDPETPIPNVDYEETEGAVITTTDTPTPGAEESGSDIYVDATVTDPSGWEDVCESVLDEVIHGKKPEVNIYVESGVSVPESALSQLADMDVTVKIHTTDNVDWRIHLKDQTTETLKGKQDLRVKLVRNETGRFSDIIGDAESFILSLGGTSLNSTLLIPLGPKAARRVATLYGVGEKGLNKLCSVLVDFDGKAAFCLAGTSEGDYIVALDVADIDHQEVLVPEALAPEYGITYGATLMDAQGNQYILTGRVNKLGFGAGTLALIVGGVLVGSFVVVGIVMVIWNKQQQKMQKYKRKRK